MGAEYQKDSDTVIVFANRIREIARKILEAKRVATGDEVTSAFKAKVDLSCAECFKRGLKPELEVKVQAADTLGEVLKSALEAERNENARRVLRKTELIKTSA